MFQHYTQGKISFFAVLICMIPCILSLYAWHITTTKQEEVLQAKFEALAKDSENALEYRLQSYMQALLAGKGFFEGSTHVDLEEWKAFVNAQQIEKNFPGMLGMGTIEIVTQQTHDAFIKAMKKEHGTFTIHPQSDAEEYYVINFIEPLAPNKEALGLNIAFEENRYAAANRAMETGKPAITEHITLVQDSKKTPGFLLLMPMYDSSAIAPTDKERRKHFKRWIYTPFIAKQLFDHLTEAQNAYFHFRVYDGTEAKTEKLIYESMKDASSQVENTLTVKKTLTVFQQPWVVEWVATPEFEHLEKNNEPLLVLLTGVLFTIILIVCLMAINNRHRSESHITPSSYLIPIIAFSITVAAAHYLKEQIVAREEAYIEHATEETLLLLKANISNKINGQIATLNRMAQRWVIRGSIPYNEWQEDARHQVKDQLGLKAVQWVDPSYHVRWVEPIEGNERAIGLNILYDETRRKLLEHANLNNQIIITPPLDLIQGYKAILAYVPIHTQDGFQGFIVGLFNVQDLIEYALPELYKNEFGIDIIHDGEILYSNHRENELSHDRFEMDNISIYNRNFSLRVIPLRHFIYENQSNLPLLIIAAGAMIAIMITIIIYFAQRTKNKTDELAEKEQLLSTFVKHAPVAVAMFDKSVSYIAASDRWYEDYGLKGEDILGKSHYDIFPEIVQNHPEWLGIHKRAIAGEVIRQDEEKFVRDDGREAWLRYELHPWYKSKGEIGGLIMFTEDITERKRLDIIKDEFVSTVNHELRTPLTSIQGSLGLLKVLAANKLDEKAERLLNISYENCGHLALLVNDILDSEKIAAGKMKYNFEVAEMMPLIESIIEQHQHYADKFKVLLSITDKAHGVYAKIDQHRFTQALGNLLSNAAKFSPESEIVTISVREENARIIISVSDKGPGIPKAFHSKIFNKFAQADSSSTRKKGGTGLGLNITKSILDAMGGDIYFETSEGKGTVFTIELPIVQPSASGVPYE